eukprot:6139391-Amphidinium_carterae.1
MFVADAQLHRAWNRVRNSICPGHSQWLNDCLPFMKELFGMPSNLAPFGCTGNLASLAHVGAP